MNAGEKLAERLRSVMIAQNDTPSWVRMVCDEAASALEASKAKIAALAAERDGLLEVTNEQARTIDSLENRVTALTAELEAMDAKLKSLSPHKTCACSYDRPGDLCWHHSPQVAALTAENATLREVLKPFAERANFNGLSQVVSLGACQRARAALRQEGKP